MIHIAYRRRSLPADNIQVINMISLYVHIPFCGKKCLYCGFYSTVYTTKIADQFLAALRQEAAGLQPAVQDRTVSTIYIGGGTPTVLSDNQIEKLLDIIRNHFSFSGDVEFTIEANPNTVTKEKLSLWQKGGVNRLSLGIQSFSDEILQALGRIHNSSQAIAALRLAKTMGFSSIAMDLMYGIPGQTKEQWSATLGRAVKENPDHISVYALSLDEGSAYLRETEAGRLVLPEDDRTAEMYEKAVNVLAEAGYSRYEISNFSRSGHECRHNLNYWMRGQYLGMGPGAWSFLSGKRYANVADIAEYCSRLSRGVPVVADSEIPDRDEEARETAFLRLRTMKGLDLAWFGDTFGGAVLNRLETSLAPLLEAGLLETRQRRLILTERGILLSNEVFASL